MKLTKKFEEFIKEGVAKKINPDSLRAKDIIEETKRKKAFLEEIKQKIALNDENANNFVEQVYNIILEFVRAKMFIDGYKASGFSAHEAEVSYMSNLEFSESDAEFMNEIRYSRNGILYYGKKFDKDYADKVMKFMDRIYLKLKSLIEKEQ